MIDGVLELLSAKGAPHAEDMNSLEEAGLAAAISPDDDVDPRLWGHLQTGQIAEPHEGESIEGHDMLPGMPGKVPGMVRGAEKGEIRGASA